MQEQTTISKEHTPKEYRKMLFEKVMENRLRTSIINAIKKRENEKITGLKIYARNFQEAFTSEIYPEIHRAIVIEESVEALKSLLVPRQNRDINARATARRYEIHPFSRSIKIHFMPFIKNAQYILETASVENIVKSQISLNRKGLSICPFHGENTPSFSVSDKKGVFKCFGMQKGGQLCPFPNGTQRALIPCCTGGNRKD